MGRTFDMYTASLYIVEIDQIKTAEFSEVSGLKNENEVVEFQEGGENTYTHKFRGPNKYSNLILKHGITQLSPAIWGWREAVIHRKTPPLVTVTVIMLDDKGEEFARWILRNAFPVKWEGPTFKAGESAIAIETLELAYDSFSFFESPPQPPPPKPPEPELKVRIDPNKGTCKAGESLSFNCVSYQGTAATSFKWKVDGQDAGTSNPLSHTFDKAGTFKVEVTAKNDQDQEDSSAASAEVTPGPFSVKVDPTEKTVKVGDSVDFKSIDVKGEPAIEWKWEFPKGVKSGEQVSQKFAQEGEFEVKLTAKNAFKQEAEGTSKIKVEKKHQPTIDLSCIGPGARQDFSNWVHYHHAMFYFQLELKCVEKVNLSITGSGGAPPYITGYWKQEKKGSVAAKGGVFDAGAPGKIEDPSTHADRCHYCKTVGPHPSKQIYKAGSNNFNFAGSETWVIAIYSRAAGTWTLTATGIAPYPCTDERPTVKDSVKWTMVTHNRPGD